MNIFIVHWYKSINGELIDTWMSASQIYDYDNIFKSSEKLRDKWNRNLNGKTFSFEIIEYSPLQK